MDALLCARDGKLAWFAVNGRRFLLPLVRALLRPDSKGEIMAAKIASDGARISITPRFLQERYESQLAAHKQNPAKFGEPGRYELRYGNDAPEDVSKCLGALQLFSLRDRVDFGYEKFELYGWKCVNEHGPRWQWDENGFKEFIQRMNEKNTWKVLDR